MIKFYKYVNLSEEESLKRIGDLCNQRLFLNPISNFNDPFDGMFTAKNNSPKHIMADKSALSKLYDEIGDGRSFEEFKKYILSKEFEHIHKKFNKEKDVFKLFGAFCFCKDSDNLPMWAYYANNHKGCCIEFTVDIDFFKKHTETSADEITRFMKSKEKLCRMLKYDLTDKIRFWLLRVGYREKKPVINYGYVIRKIADQKEIHDHIVRNSVGAKYFQWKHEKEYRLVSNLNSVESGLIQLTENVPFLRVTGIILGHNVNNDTAIAIKKLCSENNLNIFYAHCAKDSYKISVQKKEP